MYLIGFVADCIMLNFYLAQFTYQLLEKGYFFHSLPSPDQFTLILNLATQN